MRKVIARRIDNMEEAFLPDERTDLVSMNWVRHGWAYQKLANQQAIFRAGCDWLSMVANQQAIFRAGCDWLASLRSCSRFVETKVVR